MQCQLPTLHRKGKGHRRNNYAKQATNQVCNDVIAKKFKVSRQKAENT